MKRFIIFILLIIILFSMNFTFLGCNKEDRIDKYIDLLKENSFTLNIEIVIPIVGNRYYIYEKDGNKRLYNDNGKIIYEEVLDNTYYKYELKDDKWIKTKSLSPFLKYDINYVDDKLSDNDFDREGNIYKLKSFKYYDLFESYDFKDFTLRFENNKVCVASVDYKIKDDIYYKISAKIYNIEITKIVIPYV